jgi:hypothetical protein
VLYENSNIPVIPKLYGAVIIINVVLSTIVLLILGFKVSAA